LQKPCDSGSMRVTRPRPPPSSGVGAGAMSAASSAHVPARYDPAL
jgi:hypothetical protein